MERINTSMKPIVIEFQEVSYSYPDCRHPVLTGISLKIRKGEFVSIIGASGCGKSTLALVLSKIIPYKLRGDFSGSARIDGSIGILFQNFESQVFSLNVSREIAFGPANLGCSPGEIQQRVNDCAHQTGIETLLDSSLNSLSTGQKQRVALASVLSLKPDILVLDEPTAYLDPTGKLEIMEFLRKLNRNGTTIILIEHNLDVVEEYTSRIISMHDGKIIKDGNGFKSEAEKAVPGFPAAPGDTYIKRPAIRLKSVSYTYPGGTTALREIDLDIFEGEMVAIFGHNGSGKTTLAKHLNGLIKPSSGDVKIFGNAPNPLMVGYAFQNPDYQIFEKTAVDEVAFGPKNLGLNPAEVKERATEAIKAVGLEHCSQSDPHALSAGQKRCTAIASILAMRPRIIVLDEPGAGLDRRNAANLMEIAAGFNKRGHTVLILSNDIRLVSKSCHRAIVLKNGSIRFNGSMAELMENYETYIRA